MTHFWSLLLFTLLGQAAAGLMLLVTLDLRDTPTAIKRAWVAIALLIVATIFSLTHLSAPLISYFSLANLRTSWLSREILSAGLFGASMLAFVFFKRSPLRWLAAFMGMALVFVMSQVYMLPTEPNWNTWLTFFSFLASSILLGGSLLLVLDGLASRELVSSERRLLLGWLPLALVLVTGVRVALLMLQTSIPGHEHTPLEYLATGLLLAGGCFGLIVVARYAARSMMNRQGDPQADGTDEAAAQNKIRRMIIGICLVIVLIWIAEFIGRIIFYTGYRWFGM